MRYHRHFGITRPVINDGASCGQRYAHRMQTLHKYAVRLDLVEDFDAHASHYFHRADYVGRVG